MFNNLGKNLKTVYRGNRFAVIVVAVIVLIMAASMISGLTAAWFTTSASTQNTFIVQIPVIKITKYVKAEGVTTGENLCSKTSKPQTLTMQYIGGSSVVPNDQDGKVSVTGDPGQTSPVFIRASDKSNPDDKKALVYFSGEVALNGQFVIDATVASKSRLEADTYVHISNLDGSLLQTIKFHTSCSKPLYLGDRFGSIKLIGFKSESGQNYVLSSGDDSLGDDANEPPGPSFMLGDTIRWNYVVHNPGPVALENVLVVDDNATPADTGDDFSPLYISGDDGNGILDIGESWLYTYSDMASSPGQFKNIATVTANPVGKTSVVTDDDPAHYKVDVESPPPPPADLCSVGKPKILRMEYTGDGPGATTNYQDGEVKVVGDPNGAELVFIEVTDDPRGIKVYFSGLVDINETFDINASLVGESKLSPNTRVKIYTVESGGKGSILLQEVRFHTSCSKPLGLEDQFGALLLVGFMSETGIIYGDID